MTKWSKALLSGEYVQGEKKLWSKEQDEFCCLGVFCDLHPEIEWITFINGDDARAKYGADSSSGFVPKTIAVETGLEKRLTWYEVQAISSYGVPLTTNYTRQAALQTMNDVGGLSFRQIAATIILLGWDVDFD